MTQKTLLPVARLRLSLLKSEDPCLWPPQPVEIVKEHYIIHITAVCAAGTSDSKRESSLSILCAMSMNEEAGIVYGDGVMTKLARPVT